MRASAGWAAVALFAGCVLNASSAEPATRAEPAESVPLYTNDDLARFGPSTAPDAPVETRIPEDWAFVQSFLDRQYARLDAEFEQQLARSAAEAAAAPPRPRYVVPYAGIYGGWWGLPWRHPGHGGIERPASRHPEALGDRHAAARPRPRSASRPAQRGPHGSPQAGPHR